MRLENIQKLYEEPFPSFPENHQTPHTKICSAAWSVPSDCGHNSLEKSLDAMCGGDDVPCMKDIAVRNCLACFLLDYLNLHLRFQLFRVVVCVLLSYPKCYKILIHKNTLHNANKLYIRL